MKLKEKCVSCDQFPGCGFAVGEGGRDLSADEAEMQPVGCCVHVLCEGGRKVMQVVMEGGRHPHTTIMREGVSYLCFEFFEKVIPFLVASQGGEVYQSTNGELVPVGVSLWPRTWSGIMWG